MADYREQSNQAHEQTAEKLPFTPTKYIFKRWNKMPVSSFTTIGTLFLGTFF